MGSGRGRRVGQEREVNCAYEHGEGHEMVPSQVKCIKGYEAEDCEYYERDDFLHYFKLDEGIGASVVGEAYAVGRYLKAVFEQSDAPREEDDCKEWPGGRYSGGLQFEMAVPGDGHENIADDEEQNCGYCGIHAVYIEKFLTAKLLNSEQMAFTEH